MEILIKFIELNSEILYEKILLPEDFFDELNEDEKQKGYNYLSMYKYLTNPWQYSGKDKNKLVYFCFKIKDENGCIESNYTFWNEGKNWIESYKESDYILQTHYHSITINTNENDAKTKFEKNNLLRFVSAENNFFNPVLHNINTVKNNEEFDFFIETGFKV